MYYVDTEGWLRAENERLKSSTEAAEANSKRIWTRLKTMEESHELNMEYVRELEAERDAAAKTAREYLDKLHSVEDELADLKNPVYCPTCGSCGIDGCCSPTKCHTVKERFYCEENVKSWQEMNDALVEADNDAAQALQSLDEIVYQRDQARKEVERLKVLLSGRTCFHSDDKVEELLEEALQYKQAIDDALVVNHIGVVTGDAKRDLHKLICCEIDMALDPAVSSSAKALVKPYKDVINEIYQLITRGFLVPVDDKVVDYLNSIPKLEASK